LISIIVFTLLSYLISLLVWAIILQIIISWLLAFNILDSRNRLVWTINDFLVRITDPILRPIRRWVPSFGNIDLSPWIAVLLLRFVAQPILAWLFAGIHYGVWGPLF
jgi:YggT family protein